MSEDEHNHDENLTTSYRERWEWIGTIMSALILVSLIVLVIGASYSIFSLSAIGQAWFTLYSIICLMAATWIFGEGTLKAVRKNTNNE
jgi:uncharacterized membrane protein YqjE